MLASIVLIPDADGFPRVGEPGSGAGQIARASGIAINEAAGRLYVADAGNARVAAFDADTGDFEFAFGWGVRNGAGELQTCGPEATPPSSECRKGAEGGGAGQFKTPASIAVDNDVSSPSYQDVFVYDAGNTRIARFNAAGEFQLDFGSSGECQLSSNVEEAHPIAIGPGGVVHVADTLWLAGTALGGLEHRLLKFESSGACLDRFQLAELQAGEYSSGLLFVNGLAVDSSGNVHASFASFLSGSPLYEQGPSVHKYDSSGSSLGPVGQAPAGRGLAIDAADHLFVASERAVEEFDADGDPVRVFGYGELNATGVGLAPHVSAAGDIFVAEEAAAAPETGRVLYLKLPPPGPIVLPDAGLTKADPVGNTKATLTARLNPEGKETSYHAEFITEAAYQENLGEGDEGFLGATRGPGAEVDDPSIGGDFAVHQVGLQIGCSNPTQQLIDEGKCLEPETAYRFRVFASNADGDGNSPVEGAPFATQEPLEIIATWSSDVGADSATLNAEINPFGIPATGRFQYIAEGSDFQANGFENAAETGPIDFGAAEVPTARSANLEGLAPGTTYHYRVVASDLFVSERAGPPRAFHTFPSGADPSLPDGRNYEMVSPVVKNGGEVAVPAPSGGGAFISVEPQLASVDGSRMTYGSFTAFGPDPESGPATSQYLSQLGPSLWATENVNPRFEEGYGRDPFVGFSADLAHAALITIEPPLTPDATPNFPNLYVRDNVTGALTAITTQGHVPAVDPATTYCLVFGGASADFSRVVFSARGALNEGDPAGDGFNLYEWSRAGGIDLLSRLPGNDAAADPHQNTGVGYSWTQNAERPLCNAEAQRMHHAVSADGSRVFWTFGGTFKSAKEPLFARVEGKETVQLDKPVGIAGAGGEGLYQDASSDGTKVFFTSGKRLTPSSSSGGQPDLYRYDFSATGSKLVNLTVQGGEAANVRGVLGASDDGSYVYFVATGVLDAAPNSEGAVAEEGGQNLYAWHDGETRFLATLATQDAPNWSIDPLAQTARATPDGLALAFTSVDGLTGYDTTVGTGSHCESESLESTNLVGSPKCAQVYIYDFAGDELACASCNPSGQRPAGPARLPGWSTPYQQPRYLSDAGDRLFFDTLDALLPRDTNGRRDVYEFERAGSGSCSASSTAFTATSGGCLYLISTGTPSGATSDESYLLDASANGDGVFFSTRQSLLAVDRDGRFDVYDARVGAQPPAGTPESCEALCRGAGTQAAAAPAAGSATLATPPPRRSLECPRGTRKVKSKGKERCVKAKKKKKRQHGKQHPRKGRAGSR